MIRWLSHVAVAAVLCLVPVLLLGCGSASKGPTPAPSGPTPAPAPTPPGPPSPGPMHCPDEFLRGQCNQCVWNNNQVECAGCKAPYTFTSQATDGYCTFKCPSSSPKKPEIPDHVLQYKGVDWPEMCIEESEANFFGIGDWGGVCNFNGNICAPSQLPYPMDNTQNPMKGEGSLRPRVEEIDGHAQVLVAAAMAERAKTSKPKFVVNVGDNFYPGGIDGHCGADPHAPPSSKQFDQIFDAVYSDPAIKGLEWWSVLGNHDYGGVCFVAGWDAQVYYTWHSQNWVMPAPFWKRKVQFKDFSAQFIFLDTNFEDVFGGSDVEEHDICGNKGNTDFGWHCGADLAGGPRPTACNREQRPTSLEDCPKYFEALNNDQFARGAFFDKSLEESDADWTIVVTHFPPPNEKNKDKWKLYAAKHGIDLIVVGHTHLQEINYLTEKFGSQLQHTAWVITGGGGGITSEKQPQKNGYDDSYGFMDFKMSKDSITITSISHGGKVYNQTVVKPRITDEQKLRQEQEQAQLVQEAVKRLKEEEQKAEDRIEAGVTV